eukprot:Selendium_serpulae@DN6489_c0_g1_i1.p1
MSTSVSRSPSAAGARQADAWLEQIRRDPPEILTEADLMLVCERVKEILIEENNVQPVDAPVVICGDIHGQFYDLMELFDIGGNPRETNYVFLGDYVDRGHNSVETFQYLFGAKVAKEFNHINDLDMIARAHQLAMEGYRYMFADSLTSPTTYPLVTVWSAPNYCYRCGNVAAIMRIGEDLQRTFLIFKDTEASRRPLSPRLTVPYFL